MLTVVKGFGGLFLFVVQGTTGVFGFLFRPVLSRLFYVGDYAVFGDPRDLDEARERAVAEASRAIVWRDGAGELHASWFE